MRHALVLAGGKGTRLAPYTVTFPKPLMPLGDTPVLEVVIRQLVSAGFDDIVLSVGLLASLIETYFGDGSKWGAALRYTREDTPLGTAGALAAVSDLEDPVLVMNGDVLTTLDFAAILARHVASGADMTVSTVMREQAVDFGVVQTDGSGRVTGYLEKPKSELLVSMGVNVISPPALGFVHPGEPLDMPQLVLRLVGAGRFVRAERFDGYWLDIGRHDDLARAQSEFESMRPELLRERP
jgi:NDP-sugar pyrophosphorylase family protein